MKTKRIINIVCWAIVAITLIGYVCAEWHRQGCGWQSMTMAALWYGILTSGMCYLVDNAIRERHCEVNDKKH